MTGPDGSGAYHSSQTSGTVAASIPGGTDAATINVQLTITEGTGCSDDTDQIPITVERKLTPTASKSGANGSALTVTLSSAAAGRSRCNGRSVCPTCSDIAGATSGTLSTELESTVRGPGGFRSARIRVGRLYTVMLRLRARNTITHPDGSRRSARRVRAPLSRRRSLSIRSVFRGRRPERPVPPRSPDAVVRASLRRAAPVIPQTAGALSRESDEVRELERRFLGDSTMRAERSGTPGGI